MKGRNVRIGAGIKLRRNSRTEVEEGTPRLKIRETNADGSADHRDTPKIIDDDLSATDDIASIFQEGSATSRNLKNTSTTATVASSPSGQSLDRFDPTLATASADGKSSIEPIVGKSQKSMSSSTGGVEGTNFELISGIEKSSGNYLLTLGYPESGKTVLQSFLYYYLATHGDFSNRLEAKREGAQSDYLTESLLNTWLTDWNNRNFPRSTQEHEGAIREIRLRLTPKINNSKIFNFSFIEVSGEFIRKIIPTEVQPGLLVNTMHNFLVAPKSKKIIVYVFDHKPESNNDELFSSLIRYLERSVPGRLDQKYSLMIVVPNPDFVLHWYSSDEGQMRRFSNQKELQPEALLHYLRLRAPQLVATYRSWKKSKRRIQKFYIGPIKKNNAEQVLEKPDFEDCKRIINFCYRQFQGSRLNEGLFQRIIKALRS